MLFKKSKFYAPIMSGFVPASHRSSSSDGHSSSRSSATGSFCSTGAPSLDCLIKVQPGSLTAIYEDRNSFIHLTILQIFVSESLRTSSRTLRAMSPERRHLVSFAYQARPESDIRADPQLLIAWRYKNLRPDSGAFSWNLASKIPLPDEIRVPDIDSLLKELKEKKRLKVALFSFLSPIYHIKDKQSIFQLLYDIRKYARLNEHTVYLSFPSFLYDFDCSQFFDNILAVSVTLSLPHEQPLYAALLELKKFTSIGSLLTLNLESFKYGIRMTSKKFTVENIDIPPEGADHAPGSSPCSQAF